MTISTGPGGIPYPNGCSLCGDTPYNHGKKDERHWSEGYRITHDYVAPSHAVRLSRMQAARTFRKRQEEEQ